MDSISKERFDFVCSKHPQYKLVNFLVTYFSDNVKKENNYIKNIFVSVTVGLFIWGFLASVYNLNKLYISIPTVMYFTILVIMGIISITAVILHYIRKRKICKELDVTGNQLVKLEKKFYPEKYNK